MAIPILLPKVSFVVSEGTITEWLKKPGDSVNKGEPLLVIETEKATVEVEAPGSGFLGSELSPAGTTVPVTTTIGYIVEAGETSPKLELASEQLAIAPAASQPAQATEEGQGKAGEVQWMKVSPLARRIAKELGVDLAKVKGTGPNGRILQEDIQAYVNAQGHGRVSPQSELPASKTAPSSQAAVSVPSELLELSNLQRITAERMALSFRTAPHFYLNVQVDMSQAVVMREAFLPKVEAKAGVRLSFTDILVFAVGRAMQVHPALNAMFENDKLARYKDVNINLAIDTPRGLTAPVIRQADRLSLFEIAQRRVELVDRAQNNRLAPDDIINGTFTISNLGMFGIDVFHAIINPPQAAILAVGRIIKRPIVVNDVLELHPTMWLSLSVDHRVADGAEAARFLQDLTNYLENPYQILVQPA
ncbi:MAG: 2-oxo acid dehydrogenase subunit E2 [Anaerolineales bacterium]|nr:2-oxo acid dehydrogenase subunit E2 [Anaerolineales bacterium]